MEMTAAYSVFANQGLLYTPRLVERVRDAEGVLLEENLPEPREATAPAPSYVLLEMLEGRHRAGHGGRGRSRSASASPGRPGRRTTTPTPGSSG